MKLYVLARCAAALIVCFSARLAWTSPPGVRMLSHTEVEELPASPKGDPFTDDGSGMAGDVTNDGGICAAGCPVEDGCSRRGMFFGSVDYLLMRPRFSSGVSHIQTTLTNNQTTTPPSSTAIEQEVEFNFHYQSSVRASFGYRLCDCGGEVQFTYWRLHGDAEAVDIPGSDQACLEGHLICAGADQLFSSRTSLNPNIYDLDFSKCISFDGSCDSCCPTWDLRWSAGVRIADIHRRINEEVTDLEHTPVSFGDINSSFKGAGPRVGMAGRRYFGCQQRFSLFAKSNAALLLGDYKLRRATTTPGAGVTPTIIDIREDNLTRLIPVTEIEVGGSYQLTPHAYVTAGWFFQAWFDLGESVPIQGGVTGFGPIDTANIMAFDGLFVRGELTF